MPADNSSLVIEAIRRQNAGRDPDLLAMKYAKMKQNAFAFLRGACHLFYDFLPDDFVARTVPLAWCCGDLHFENFGSYKADNRLAYFDINDYDEAALSPCTWDIVRLLTSLRCAADSLQTTSAESVLASRVCLDAYRAALMHGKPLWVERETSTGLIHELLSSLQERKRADFLDRRTVRRGSHRLLRVDGVKALPATDAQRHKVSEFVARFAAAQADPGFYELQDVARRVAGTGSLGVTRFVLLVAGKGSPDGNYLLDLKEARPSVLSPRLERIGIEQPNWPDEAHRVVAIEKRMQAVDHAFLVPVEFDRRPFILKALQPSEDRIAIGEWGRKQSRLQDVVAAMGQILAWDQLRSAGRGGSASADQLIAFAEQAEWMKAVLAATEAMTLTTRQQWKIFKESAL